MIKNPNPLFNTNPADGLDCTLKSSSGKKAGEMFPRQATEILCLACKNNNVTVVRGMLAAGTYINQCNKHYLSPLMCASMVGAIDVINVLVSHGANVSFVNKKNKTSLLLACERKQWLTAIVLHQHIMAREAGIPTDKRSNNDKAFNKALKFSWYKVIFNM